MGREHHEINVLPVGVADDAIGDVAVREVRPDEHVPHRLLFQKASQPVASAMLREEHGAEREPIRGG